MAEWKKVIVSGSTAELANLTNAGVAQHAAVVGGGAGASQTGVSLGNGQILIGAVGAAPTAATITTADFEESGSIKVTTGTNSIKLQVANEGISTFNLSGSKADVPTLGQTVKVGANGAFTFDDASSLLSAGIGITIANNKISSSIANSDMPAGNGNSYGTAGSTEFTGSFKGSLDGTAAIATTVTITDNEATNETNAIIFGAGADLDGGDLGLESDGDFTYNPKLGSLNVTSVTASLQGSVVGDTTGAHNGTVGASTPAVGAFTNITTTGNATIAGDLIVEGTTTEVRTANLSIQDKLITLASGSVAADASAVTIEPGIVFSGARIGADSTFATTLNSGSALYIDKDSQRLTVTTNAVAPNKSVLGMDANRAHIPLVLTGSFVGNAQGAQIGNFKVDNNGEFYVYTA